MARNLFPVSKQFDGDKWTLVVTRVFDFPLERVWTFLTDPTLVALWAPFDPDRNLGSQGPAHLTMADRAGGETAATMVDLVQPLSRLEYDWNGDDLSWKLEPILNGTRLVLSHTVRAHDWLPKVAAGWHLCFDTMEKRLSGENAPRVVGMEALNHGWDELHLAYAKKLDVEPTPLP
jgi:uncharacterized protein YndB with AHSA1/START domain